jgi:UDP-N-acetylglucosamine transferase subunit ALG13
MIFVTIGSLFPFDRLIEITDRLAAAMPEQRFFAQIGESTYEPRHMDFARRLNRPEFTRHVAESDLIIAHAGMGSVITALEAGKPIIIVPRILELGEHTTDHQMATARWLQGRPGIHVVMNDADLGAAVAEAIRQSAMGVTMGKTAPEAFTRRIREYLESADR